MVNANLYLDRIDFSPYLSAKECKKCGADSCRHLVEKLKSSSCTNDKLGALPRETLNRLQLFFRAEKAMPSVQSLQLPQPGPVGLVELNRPGPEDPVLVTGNSRLTHEVLLAVLSTTKSPFFLLCVDTNGDTLDMSLVLGSFTPERIQRLLRSEKLAEKAASSALVLPGLAKKLKQDIAAATGWPVEVGPVCAAELPLVFGSKWLTVG